MHLELEPPDVGGGQMIPWKVGGAPGRQAGREGIDQGKGRLGSPTVRVAATLALLSFPKFKPRPFLFSRLLEQ